MKKDFKKENSSLIIFFLRLFFIGVIIVCGYFIFVWNNDNMQNEKVLENVSQYIANNNEDNFIVDFDALCEINPSCFAYLIVNGVDIRYPVVKHTDNEYYLTHSFDNSPNAAGWIFADYQNMCDGTDKNLVIYGHNRHNNSMFSPLLNILNEEWYTNPNNQIVKLYTKTGLTEYQVFSVYETKATTDYITINFSGNDSFKSFVQNLKNKSIYDFKTNISGYENILTLSTCSNNNNYRTVLHAYKKQ